MENSTRDYYAPLGMSPFDFNSLIRSRFLDDLIDRLVEQGIVRRPESVNRLASVGGASADTNDNSDNDNTDNKRCRRLFGGRLVGGR
jgi:hypothetical protein